MSFGRKSKDLDVTHLKFGEVVVSDGVPVQTTPAAPHSFSRTAETCRRKVGQLSLHRITIKKNNPPKAALNCLLSPCHQFEGIHSLIPGSSTGKQHHKPVCLLDACLQEKIPEFLPETINSLSFIINEYDRQWRQNQKIYKQPVKSLRQEVSNQIYKKNKGNITTIMFGTNFQKPEIL